jgi:hypothetical protein
VKGYRKLTLITAMLGLVILVPFVVGYAYVNSLIGLPILGLFLGWLILYVFLLLIVNIASLFIAFRIKNTKIAGILLIVCGCYTRFDKLLRNSLVCLILYCGSTCIMRETNILQSDQKRIEVGLKERQTRRVPLISHSKIFMLLILRSILFELL